MSAFPKSVLRYAVPRKLPIAAKQTAEGPVFYLSDGQGGAVGMGGRTWTKSASGFLAALRDYVAAREREQRDADYLRRQSPSNADPAKVEAALAALWGAP